MKHRLLTPYCTALLMLAGCAGFSRDGGFDEVAKSAHEQLGAELNWPRDADGEARTRAEVDSLLSKPIGPKEAVQIALLQNPGLRAEFESLQISEAELVQAGRLPNPRFDLRRASAAGQYDIEETLSFNVIAMMTMPAAQRAARQRFGAAQLAVSARVADLAALARIAYYRNVAARQRLEYLTRVNLAADAGAQLARRMQAAGNWNRVDEAREEAFRAEAEREFSRAQRQQSAAREQLLRILGFAAEPSGSPLKLAAELPDLPVNTSELPDVERIILDNRTDLKRMRQALDALARDLKLTRATRFVNVLDLGATRVKQGTEAEPYERGFSVTLEIPIFDGGEARVKRAAAVYRQAAERFAQAAVDARSQIRQAYAAYRSAYDIARLQRDEVVPLRKAVAAENLLRYNASLISVFELLADTRDEAMSVSDYIDSLCDFWVAKSQLDAVLLGSLEP
jgi:outer membrane protein TolC